MGNAAPKAADRQGSFATALGVSISNIELAQLCTLGQQTCLQNCIAWTVLTWCPGH